MPPPTFASQGQLAVMHRTTDLYRACMSLAAEGRSLLRENEGMKRLGLNAQVMAAHTGQNGGSLEVIVAEIGRLSTSIRETLGSIVALVPTLNEASISTLHRSHLRTSYALGSEAGIDARNQVTYQANFDGLCSQLEADLASLENDLAATGVLLCDLERIAQQIPPVASLIRIVVAEIHLKSEELLGTVADLALFHELLDGKIERMREISRRAQERIGELRGGMA